MPRATGRTAAAPPGASGSLDRPESVRVYNTSLLQSLTAEEPPEPLQSPGLGSASQHGGRSARAEAVSAMFGAAATSHAQQRTGVLDPVRTPAERIAGGRARRGSLAQVIDQPVIKPIKAKDPKKIAKERKLVEYKERTRVMFERIAAQVKASREAKRKKAEKAYRESLRSIRQGNKFVEDVQHNLETHAAAAMLKQRSRHAEWEEKVFDPVAKSINDAINTRSTKQIARLRQHEYDKFLEATRSRDLFTDIVTEEYDPFTLNRVAPRAKKPTVFDPSSRVLARPAEEAALNAEFTRLRKSAEDAERAEQERIGAARALRPQTVKAASTKLGRVTSAPGGLGDRKARLGSAGTERPGTAASRKSRASISVMSAAPSRRAVRVVNGVRQAPLQAEREATMLPVPMWGSGKLESTMAGLKAADESHATIRRMQKESKRNRKQLFGDHYEQYSPRSAARRYNREMPKPTKKTFRQGHISQNVALIMKDPPAAAPEADLTGLL